MADNVETGTGHNIVTGETAETDAGKTGLGVGAVVGGVIGAAVGGPVGAVVGGAAGSLLGGASGDAAEAMSDPSNDMPAGYGNAAGMGGTSMRDDVMPNSLPNTSPNPDLHDNDIPGANTGTVAIGGNDTPGLTDVGPASNANIDVVTPPSGLTSGLNSSM